MNTFSRSGYRGSGVMHGFQFLNDAVVINGSLTFWDGSGMLVHRGEQYNTLQELLSDWVSWGIEIAHDFQHSQWKGRHGDWISIAFHWLYDSFCQGLHTRIGCIVREVKGLLLSKTAAKLTEIWPTSDLSRPYSPNLEVNCLAYPALLLNPPLNLNQHPKPILLPLLTAMHRWSILFWSNCEVKDHR